MILRLPYFSDPLAKLERRSLVSPRSDHGLHDVTFVINGTLEEQSLPLIFRKTSFRYQPDWDETRASVCVAYGSRRRTSGQTGSTRTEWFRSWRQFAPQEILDRNDNGYRMYTLLRAE